MSTNTMNNISHPGVPLPKLPPDPSRHRENSSAQSSSTPTPTPIPTPSPAPAPAPGAAAMPAVSPASAVSAGVPAAASPAQVPTPAAAAAAAHGKKLSNSTANTTQDETEVKKKYSQGERCLHGVFVCRRCLSWLRETTVNERGLRCRDNEYIGASWCVIYALAFRSREIIELV